MSTPGSWPGARPRSTATSSASVCSGSRGRRGSMDVLPGELERDIVAAVDQVLADRCTALDVRATVDGLLPPLWDAAVEQGWFGLAVAEEQGGAGLSIVELALVAESLGRRLAPG